MKYSYYPGCTLRNKAKDLDEYARASARALGFELEEIEDWQCCGGVYPLGTDEIATKLSSVRALNQAKEKGQDLVTICSACHHVIKRVNDDMKNVEDIRTRANNYMQLDEPYEGETTVLHYLEVLRDKVGFDKLKEKVVNPLTGKKIGAYYGCLLLRPGKIMAFDDPENPTIMEDFIRALGAEPVIYPYRNECCGGYISLKEKDMSQNMCQKIEDSAKGFGADMLITACPLCKYNLNKNDYILFLARIVPEKGLDNLIDAYMQIETDKKLLIAGGASHTNEYLEHIKEKVKDNKNIIMTGFVQGEELDELYSNAYLYCLPSHIEGMPISLLEAFSYGCNVLISDIDENVQVAEQYATKFKMGNVEDLAKKLKECLEDKNRYDSKEIQEFILNKYSWNDVVEKTMKIYKEIKK